MRSICVFVVMCLIMGIFVHEGLQNTAHSNATGAPAGHSGSPGDGFATCTNCHSGPAPAFLPGLITSNIPLTGYVPGQVYTITATIVRTGHTRFGFQVSPQSSGGSLLGALINTSSQTQIVGSGKYITHTLSGTSGSGSKVWNFNWQAPMAGTGNVTFYGSFNVTNNNNSNSGDTIYTSSMQLSEGCSQPVASYSASALTICQGSSVVLTNSSSNAVSYQWKENGVLFSSTTNASRTFNVPGSYEIRLVAFNGNCTDSTAKTIVVNPLPSTSSINGSSSVCQNQGGLLYSVTNTSGSTYLWTVPSGTFINSGQGTNQIQVTAGSSSGNITVTETNTFGCIGNLQSLNVTIIPVVTASVSISANSNPACAGSMVSFTATPVNGGSSPAYQWQINGMNVGTNNSTYASSGLSAGDQIICIMTSSEICINGSPAFSNMILMNVIPVVSASVSISASTNPACAGSQVTFTATPVNGGSAPDFQWKVNGLNTGTNNSIFITGSLNNGDMVSCVMNSNEVCVTGSPATSNVLNMNIIPGVTASVSISANFNPVCSGTLVTFTALPVNGGTNPMYQWKINGINSGLNNSTLSSSTLADNDIITCVMTSNELCVSGSPATSNSVTMTVNPILTPLLSVSAISNPSCAGDTVNFIATPTHGGNLPLYQWYLNGMPLGLNSPFFSSSGLVNGDQIFCILTSSEACVSASTASSNTVIMNVSNSLPASVSITVSPSDTSCGGLPVSFNAFPGNGGSNPSYQWILNGSNTGSNSPLYTHPAPSQGDQISCLMTSSGSCVTGSPATSNTITITVIQPVVASVSVSASKNNICTGEQVDFAAIETNGGTTPMYQWKINGNNTGTNSMLFSSTTLSNNDVVNCTMTSSKFCVSGSPAVSNNVNMTVNPVVTASVSISANSNPACAGSMVSFTATPVNGGSSPAYQWQVNGMNVGTNNSTYSSSGLSAGDQIICIMTSNETCINGSPAFSNMILMNILPVVNASVSITASANPVCAGTPVTFTAFPVNGGTSPSYQWQINGLNAGTNNAIFVTSSLTNGDTISCNMSSNETCVAGSPATSNAISVTVNPLPLAEAGPDVFINLGDSTQLFASGGVSFIWSPVMGLSNVNIANPIAKPSTTTLYYVTVTDSNGCSAMDSVNVTVGPVALNDHTDLHSMLKIYPNPFRDDFRVLLNHSSTDKTELKLFNSLGELKYHSKFDNPSGGTSSVIIHENQASLTPGIYFLVVYHGSALLTSRIVKLD